MPRQACGMTWRVRILVPSQRSVTVTRTMLRRQLTNCGETPLFLAARAGRMSVTPVPRSFQLARPSDAALWRTPDATEVGRNVLDEPIISFDLTSHLSE